MLPKCCSKCCSQFSCFTFIKGIIYIVGLTCFFVHVSDSWIKYTGMATTFTSTYVTAKQLQLPSIALCSRKSFNSTELQKLNVSRDFFNFLSVSAETWKKFDSRHELEMAWDSAAIFINNLTTLTFRGKVNGQKREVEVDRRNISNFNSFAYGKCSTIKEFPIFFTSTNDMLSIQVDMSSFGDEDQPEIDVWFSSPGSEIFGTVGMFVGDISMFTTHPGNIYSFYVSERVTNFKPSGKYNCSQNNNFSNYTKCLEKYVVGLVEQEMESGNSSGIPCYFPYFSKFVPRVETPCQKSMDMFAMRNFLIEAGETFANSQLTGCQEPCTKQKFNTNIRSVPAAAAMQKAKMLQISLSFEDIRIEQLDEYVLFDFGAITGAVGGSLGLFLGLSFADICIFVVSNLGNRISARFGKREGASATQIKCRQKLDGTDP